jgi:hypothetical protein
MAIVILDNETVRGTLSSSDIIYAKGGDSDKWNSTFSTLCAQSGNNASVYSNVYAKSAGWELASNGSSDFVTWTKFSPASAYWQSTFSTLCAQSGNNISVYTTVCAYSANWQSISNGGFVTYSNLGPLTGKWESTYSTLCAQSGNNASVYTTVKTYSSDWQNTTSWVKNNSASATFTISVSAPSLSGTHYGDGSKLTGISSGSSISSTVSSKWENASTWVQSNTAAATFTISVSAPSLSGTHYGDGSKLTDIVASNGVCQQGGFGKIIAGGCNNVINNAAWCASILGGDTNTANCVYSVIGGGNANCIDSTNSNILGGSTNKICTASSFTSIVGGRCNTASGVYSFIAGGCRNVSNSLNNTFLLGSGLSASQADYTYVNNLSSQGSIYGKTLTTTGNICATNNASICANQCVLAGQMVAAPVISACGTIPSSTYICSNGYIRATNCIIAGSHINAVTCITAGTTILAPSLSASGKICSTGSGFYGDGTNITGRPFGLLINNNFSCLGEHTLCTLGVSNNYGPSSILGGLSGCIPSTNASSIVGGQRNYIIGAETSVGSFIGAGICNSINASLVSNIGAGACNCIIGGSKSSFIGAGECNCIMGASIISTIVAAASSCIVDNSQTAAILNGACHSICKSPASSIISGYCNNIRNTGSTLLGQHNSIIGGNQNTASGYNINSTIVIGGALNCNTSDRSIIAAGGKNCILTNNNVDSGIVGGTCNTIGTSVASASACASFIGGGFKNCVTTLFNTAFGTGACTTRYNEFAIGYNSVKDGSQFSIIQFDGIASSNGNITLRFNDSSNFVFPNNSISFIDWDIIVTTIIGGLSATAAKFYTLTKNVEGNLTHTAGYNVLLNNISTNASMISAFGFNAPLNPINYANPYVGVIVPNVRIKLTGKISQLLF